jgi:hypothetical protein
MVGRITESNGRRFRWFVTALQEARMRKVEQELRRYRQLLPDGPEWAACKLTPRSEDQLPFLRRFD